eukprot:1178685-Prorocentrum_minimum.AAC.3
MAWHLCNTPALLRPGGVAFVHHCRSPTARWCDICATRPGSVAFVQHCHYLTARWCDICVTVRRSRAAITTRTGARSVGAGLLALEPTGVRPQTQTQTCAITLRDQCTEQPNCLSGNNACHHINNSPSSLTT